MTKIIIAAIAPPIRVSMSGPMPIPSRWSSEAGIVMLFHSPMSRMNRTLPDVLDGESEPKTASWRAHHGAMTRTKTATAPTAAAHEMGLRRPLGVAGVRDATGPPRAPAIPREHEPERGQDEQAVVPGERREPGEEARPQRTAPSPSHATPRAAIQSDAMTSGW